MSAADRSTKDKAMAAHLKSIGDKRTHMRCPMCHAVIGLHTIYGHLSVHAGGKRYDEDSNTNQRKAG